MSDFVGSGAQVLGASGAAGCLGCWALKGLGQREDLVTRRRDR